MNFIKKRQDVIDNIITLEGYLTGKDKTQKQFAEQLVKSSKTFCVYKVNGENHFAPSRFLGYKNNTMDDHLANEGKDGKDANSAIDKVVGRHFTNDTTEEKFKAYVSSLGLTAVESTRKYWRVKDERGKNLDIKL